VQYSNISSKSHISGNSLPPYSRQSITICINGARNIHFDRSVPRSHYNAKRTKEIKKTLENYGAIESGKRDHLSCLKAYGEKEQERLAEKTGEKPSHIF
jgi:hypothetical protein